MLSSVGSCFTDLKTIVSFDLQIFIRLDNLTRYFCSITKEMAFSKELDKWQKTARQT